MSSSVQNLRNVRRAFLELVPDERFRMYLEARSKTTLNLAAKQGVEISTWFQ